VKLVVKADWSLAGERCVNAEIEQKSLSFWIFSLCKRVILGRRCLSYAVFWGSFAKLKAFGHRCLSLVAFSGFYGERKTRHI